MKIYKNMEFYVDGCKHTCEIELHIDADDCRAAIEENPNDGERAVLLSFGDFISFWQAVPDEIYAGFTDKHREILSKNIGKVLAKIQGNSTGNLKIQIDCDVRGVVPLVMNPDAPDEHWVSPSGSDCWCSVRDLRRLMSLETTVKTFLHDIDNHNPDQGKVLMSSLMWMQVKAFKRLIRP